VTRRKPPAKGKAKRPRERTTLPRERDYTIVLSAAEVRILSTLAVLNPFAAASYEQAILDLGGRTRPSYRGTAHELREALRETLDELAPDADVKAEAGFKFEEGQEKPTMRQKTRFILRKRRTAKNAIDLPADSVSRIEDLGDSIARSTYVRSSMNAHTAAALADVRQMKMYVDAVLGELLEIHRQRT
jgi:hypothetical protein